MRSAALTAVFLVIGLLPAPAAAQESRPPAEDLPAHDPATVIVTVERGGQARPGVASTTEANQAGSAAAAVGDDDPDRLTDGVYEVEVDDVESAIAELAERRGVVRVERNWIVHLASATAPNDPQYPNLWGLHNTGQTVEGQIGTVDADIDAPEAWATTTGDPSVVIGIVDTGIDATHPDLAANLWSNPGGVGECGAGTHGYDGTAGSCGIQGSFTDHGSHVAGTVAATGDNSIGVVGVAPDVRLMDLRIFDANEDATLAGIIDVLDFALRARRDHDINLVALNNSWGGGPFSESLRDIISELNDHGVLFVAAAGNGDQAGNGINLEGPSYFPCGYEVPNVICVAALDNQDNLATFSNYGATRVDLGAPGVKVLSAVQGPAYAYFNGTSMATPHVTGVAALMASRCEIGIPALTAQILLDTVEPVAALAGKTVSEGRVNAAAAVAAACPALASPDQATTVAAPGAVRLDLPVFAHNLTGQTITGAADPTGVPAGLEVTVEPFVVSTDTESAMLAVDVTTTGAVPLGAHDVTVNLSAGGAAATAVLSVTVESPSLLVAWPGLHPAVVQGTVTQHTVSVANLNHATGSLELVPDPANTPPGLTVTHPPITLTGSPTIDVPVTFEVATDAALGDAQIDPKLEGTPVPDTLRALVVRGPAASFSGAGLVLPTSGSNTLTSTVTVPPGTPTERVTVRLDGLSHTWLGDLTVTVTDPGGASVTLFDVVGGVNNSNDFINAGLVFADYAGSTVPATGDSGIYRPQAGGLNSLGSSAGGDWTLTVVDHFDQDGGALDSWSIVLDDVAPITPAAPTATPGVGQGVLDLDWTMSHLEQGATVTVTRVPLTDPPVVVADQIPLTDGVALGVPTAEPEGTMSYTVATESWSGLTDSVSLDGVVVDRTAPPAPTLAPAAGQSSTLVGGTTWFTEPVTIEVTETGPDPDLPDGTPGSGTDPATTADLVENREGPVTVTHAVSDLAGNDSSEALLDVHIDHADPVIDLEGCPTGTVTRGSIHEVDVTASDSGSGLDDDPVGSHPLDTATTGAQTFTATATDLVGHTATATCDYTVVAPAPGPGPGPVEPPTDPPIEPPIDPTESVEGDEPKPLAVAVSNERFADAGAFAQAEGRPTATHAVLARVDVFADALAAAPLSGTGPLLFTDSDGLDDVVADELARVLPPGGTVYLLGGEHALNAEVETAVRTLDLEPVRLAGPSRVETALVIADTVLGEPPPAQSLPSHRGADGAGEVMLARAYGVEGNPTAAWADALTGGAYGAATGTPIVLTPAEALHPRVADWLAGHAEADVIVLGGEAAVSPEAVAPIVGARRVAGPDRAATATAIAGQLWGPLATGGFAITNGFRQDGWAFGLAGAGLAADRNAPLLLTGDTVPPATHTAVADCQRDTSPPLLFLSSHVGQDVRDDLAGAWAADCAA